jgi:hypothetical protein
MDLKKHADTVVILGAIVSSILWMNSKFNDVNDKLHDIENRVTKIETVLILRNIYPSELASTKEYNTP